MTKNELGLREKNIISHLKTTSKKMIKKDNTSVYLSFLLNRPLFIIKTIFIIPLFTEYQHLSFKGFKTDYLNDVWAFLGLHEPIGIEISYKDDKYKHTVGRQKGRWGSIYLVDGKEELNKENIKHIEALCEAALREMEEKIDAKKNHLKSLLKEKASSLKLLDLSSLSDSEKDQIASLLEQFKTLHENKKLTETPVASWSS